MSTPCRALVHFYYFLFCKTQNIEKCAVLANNCGTMDIVPERKERSLEYCVSYCCGSDWQGAAETMLVQPDSTCTAYKERAGKHSFHYLTVGLQLIQNKQDNNPTCQAGSHLFSWLGELDSFQGTLSVHVLPPFHVLSHSILDLLSAHPFHDLMDEITPAHLCFGQQGKTDRAFYSYKCSCSSQYSAVHWGVDVYFWFSEIHISLNRVLISLFLQSLRHLLTLYIEDNLVSQCTIPIKLIE